MSQRNSNVAGSLGFVFAVLGAAFCWLPYIGGFCWLLGAILSCVGLSGRDTTLAWCGFWISLVWIICYFIFGLIWDTYPYLTIYPLYYW